MPDALISYPFTEEGLRDALEALGSTEDAVARNLGAMGFKGCRSKEHNCPVANYLLASISGAQKVSVLCGYADLHDDDSGRISAEWTFAIDDFVTRFDAGLLPQLEVPDGSS